MLGSIIGDIIGSSFEVCEIKSLKNKNSTYKNRMIFLDSNTLLFPQNSSYTDDSVLTAAIAECLLNNGDSDTIASIVGTISEAYYGIDEKIVNEAMNYIPDYIKEVIQEFYTKRKVKVYGR